MCGKQRLKISSRIFEGLCYLVTRPPVTAVVVTIIFTVIKTVTQNETVTYFQQYFSGDLSVFHFF